MSKVTSVNAALERRRNYSGPALLSYGFRPFFLGAAAWAALGILLWLPQFFGELTLPTHFGARDWHIHEMLYGYVAAAIAGFLLTAIPNWTGRLPVNGLPLGALALLWLAGRAAILLSANIGAVAAAVIDTGFLVTLFALAAREIISGQNWRNLRVLAVLAVLIAGNVVFHAEVIFEGSADYGTRIAIAAAIALIMVIGGRIIPSFTNNWLVRNNPGRLPVPFSRFDIASIVIGALALMAWVAAPAHKATGLMLMLAGLLQFWRLCRWAGDRTIADRLVLILHIGYFFVPLGFLLTGAAAWWPMLPPGAGIHAWTAGAIGLMPLAVMTRASLGHTGQALVASPGTQIIYACALLAAALRVAAAFDGSLVLLYAAAFAWVAAFGGFVVVYGPALIGRPPGWKDARG
jgi:uncharacterized protein involved in response to NO